MTRSLAAALLLAASLPASASAGPKEDALWRALKARIETVEKGLDGVLGVSIKDLKTGTTLEILPDEAFPQASVIKLAVLYELYRQAEEGRVNMAEVTRPPATRVGGGGILKSWGPP